MMFVMEELASDKAAKGQFETFKMSQGLTSIRPTKRNLMKFLLQKTSKSQTQSDKSSSSFRTG